jgi:murein L,D-transpeptidase YcbB/YkuD
MCIKKNIHFLIFSFLFLLIISSCDEGGEKQNKKVLPDNISELNINLTQNIQSTLSMALENNGEINDDIHLNCSNAIDAFYNQREYYPVWSDTGRLKPLAIELIKYLDTCIYDGLLKSDYHFEKISTLKNYVEKNAKIKKDVKFWTQADLLLTDALFKIMADLKQGRLIADSISFRKDKTKHASFFINNFNDCLKNSNLKTLLIKLQPTQKSYISLRNGIRNFVSNMDTQHFTYLKYPYNKSNVADSLLFMKLLQNRLQESGFILDDIKDSSDSIRWGKLILSYQKKNNLQQDGKIGNELISHLNVTDSIKLKRIFISLDRYKELSDSLPSKYIWVNLPSYHLQVWDADTVVMTSKIICGKKITPTPLLKSEINEIVTFPTWTVPSSIIKKEMLPGLKRNPGYLARKGLRLYDQNGNKIDPTTINWSKYAKGIPYRIMQGSGTNNALGVIKFNFKNPFDVYLHDTNQRYLFNNSKRSLSHGCVRVQDWEQLSKCILRNDSALVLQDTSISKADSISQWIAKRERHRLVVNNKMPLYIQYITCEGVDGIIKFHEDIYDEDKKMIEKYFNN